MLEEKRIVNKAKRLTLLAMFSAMALIAFLVESLFPSLIVPGAKMGLGNIFVMLTLYLFGAGEAFCVLLVKCVLGNLITGNLSSMAFALFAGVASLLTCALLKTLLADKISVTAVSVCGAVVNNLAQNAVYAFITQTLTVFFYAPYLALIGIIGGTVVGLATVLILRRLPKFVIDNI